MFGDLAHRRHVKSYHLLKGPPRTMSKADPKEYVPPAAPAILQLADRFGMRLVDKHPCIDFPVLIYPVLI
ncbi:hypothetical protein PH5382_01344 [Phaeobacter sp. CECT 5382]|nr:hypothetical protein PH5382_01344 [Phaeobacter sp. CECT 5382]